jgi:Secretion system C-terminal sorting domain
MKTFLLFLISLVIGVSAFAQNTDLPTPNSNLKTLPDGSYVIPMDNTLQTDNVIGAGNFNLAAYGLVVHLLNNNVKVKWVIKAGKVKDGIDFTGMAEELKPDFVGGAVSRDFIAGPFVIFANDTTGVAAMIDNFYTINSLTGNNRPRVFKTSAAVLNVDIRYDLTGFIPKGAILTDGGKAAIQVNFMNLCKVSSTNFMTASAPQLLTSCFTFASEPHNDNIGPVTDANISAIKRFVQFGGNFLAECMAIPTYENNPLGHFQTTDGITVTNAALGTSLSYPNADLSFSQFQGSFHGNLKGSCMNWEITSGSSTNNDHHHATGTGINSGKIAASVSKLKTGIGGLVFFLGNHDFALSDGLAGYNGIRMYMNAFLTPVTINQNCSIGQVVRYPLPVKLTAFNANLGQDQSKVNLTWATATEINASHFIVERSEDGTTFNEVGTVLAFGNSTETKNYQLSDNIISLKATVVYYRLRQVDNDGKAEYSLTRVVKINKLSGNTISIFAYPNPVSHEIRITIPANWQNKKITYELLNVNGETAKRVEASNSSQTETMNISNLSPGFYIVRVNFNGQTAQQKIIKQ